MAPRRHGSGHGAGLLEVVGNPFQQQQSQSQQQQQQQQLEALESLGLSQLVLGGVLGQCCTPAGECLRGDSLVRASGLQDCVRVLCNNEACSAGQFMHRECFDAWEQTVLAYLKSCGRARSWSERQRQQNLWTKKGYDLVSKVCGCKCGRGHLRKDLDWLAGSRGQEDAAGPGFAGEAKKKKRRNRQNAAGRSAGAPVHAQQQSQQQQIQQQQQQSGPGGYGLLKSSEAQSIAGDGGSRARAGSLSSSTGSSSPPAETSISPLHQPQSILKKKSKVEFFGERIRQSCGANGIFSRRMDFSAFNSLPRTKLNSYHIKMEDEGNHGNDDTRSFILTTLASLKWSRVSCVLCRAAMLVFDRYPLVDGTFFLSPRKHSAACAEVQVEGRTQFLSAVCMSCLEGCGGFPFRCTSCAKPWDGSSLVLGTMYSYDIFAAMPCCSERLRCNSCHHPLIYPHQKLNFYSDYSRVFACPHCRAVDAHFVKPLSDWFTREHFPLFSPWP